MKIKDLLSKLAELNPDDEDTEFLYYHLLRRKIVGPWVPCIGFNGREALARYFGESKIAIAYTALEANDENNRLLDLCYELTDLDRDLYKFFGKDY